MYGHLHPPAPTLGTLLANAICNTHLKKSTVISIAGFCHLHSFCCWFFSISTHHPKMWYFILPLKYPKSKHLSRSFELMPPHAQSAFICCFCHEFSLKYKFTGLSEFLLIKYFRRKQLHPFIYKRLNLFLFVACLTWTLRHKKGFIWTFFGLKIRN